MSEASKYFVLSLEKIKEYYSTDDWLNMQFAIAELYGYVHSYISNLSRISWDLDNLDSKSKISYWVDQSAYLGREIARLSSRKKPSRNDGSNYHMIRGYVWGILSSFDEKKFDVEMEVPENIKIIISQY